MYAYVYICMCLYVMWGFYVFLTIHLTRIMNLLYRKLLILCSGCQADFPPVPLTPDYGGPVVSYADGVFDARFGRYVTVQEGRFLRFFFFIPVCYILMHW